MTNAKKPIPDFKNRQEMAEWFDTHDMTEYDFKPVKVRFAKNLSAGLNIRLDPHSLEQLRTVAHEKGIGPTTLVRMWVMEHLKAAH
jgi:predicted DNA binding CopG/RHH family protein